MAVRELLDGACSHCGGTGEIRAVNPAWLRFVRWRAKVSLRTMAARLSFSAADICDIEHGRRAVSAKIHEAYKKL